MSSGSSSQVWACFSVERTKYLMLSKSMPDRSAPQVGIGLRPKICSALRRFFSIHSGSFLRFEMSVTTSSETPRRAEAPALSESDQPNSYWPRLASSGRSMSTSDMGLPLLSPKRTIPLVSAFRVGSFWFETLGGPIDSVLRDDAIQPGNPTG